MKLDQKLGNNSSMHAKDEQKDLKVTNGSDVNHRQKTTTTNLKK